MLFKPTVTSSLVYHFHDDAELNSVDIFRRAWDVPCLSNLESLSMYFDSPNQFMN
jgi:hypothetical protein